VADDRYFSVVGDGSYSYTWEAMGLQLFVDRLRRVTGELHGELATRCTLAGVKTFGDHYVSISNFNLSSARSRAERATLLRKSTGLDEVDWAHFIEEFCVSVISAERAGTAARELDTYEAAESDRYHYIDGKWPWPMHDPMITFADGGAMKSMLLLYGAARLAERGLRVLYADFEWNPQSHAARLRRMFSPPPKGIHYLRCERPLVIEIDRLMREVRQHDIDYVICDSCGFGTDGPPEAAESALGYMRAARAFGVGSHHAAHISKAEAGDQKPFGSGFWHNSARATWFAKRTDPGNDPSRVTVGLYNRKVNDGARLPALAYEFEFASPSLTRVRLTDIAEVDELATTLPIWQRITQALKGQGGFPMSIEDLAARLDAEPKSIMRALQRDKDSKGSPRFVQLIKDGETRVALFART
jgi:hypothetical protein